MTTTTAIWLVAIAVFSAICGPLVMALFQQFSAAKTAKVLLASNQAVAEVASAFRQETATSLKQIHTLVNSNLTAAQHRELDASRAMLAAMREVIILKEDRGISIAHEAIDAVDRAEKRINELARELNSKQDQIEAQKNPDVPRSPPS